MSRPLLVDVEVAVLDQQRHLERRPLGQGELAFTLVADDPHAGQARIDVVLGDAHDVVVVPEQRGPLVVRVVEDGGLAGRHQVLSPAVIDRGGQSAVQVYDREAGQGGRHLVGRASTEAGEALDRHAVGLGILRSDRHHDR